MGLLVGMLRAMVMVHDCRDSNQEKIDAAIKKYWDACKYPRKTKKKLRKEAQKEYDFYISLQETLDFYG
jgi:hypothetical protein